MGRTRVVWAWNGLLPGMGKMWLIHLGTSQIPRTDGMRRDLGPQTESPLHVVTLGHIADSKQLQ